MFSGVDASPLKRDISSLLNRSLSKGKYLSSLFISFIQDGYGAVVRTVQDKLRESKSLKDFGAKGDGIANDTAPILAAAAYIVATGESVFVPAGTYLTDPFSLTADVYASQGAFFGFDRTRAIIKRRVDGANPLITIGSIDSNIFQSHVGLSGITVDAGATTNGPAVRAYNLSRSIFTDCVFKGGSISFDQLGGVSVTYRSCVFSSAVIGLNVDKYTSTSLGDRWPNLTRLESCEVVDNTGWGVKFDNGVLLSILDSEIEANGDTRGGDCGGVYVGPNIGIALTASNSILPGVVIERCWIERNKGVAQLLWNSGNNTVKDSFFFANGTDYVVYDIRLVGGRFRIIDCDFTFTAGKTANISEGPGTTAGNLIDLREDCTITYSRDKTIKRIALVENQRFGAVPTVYNATSPIMQTGLETGSTGTVSVTFPWAFKTGTTPMIFCQVVVNSVTTDTVKIYNRSASGFTMKKQTHTAGGSISDGNFDVVWFAIGEY